VRIVSVFVFRGADPTVSGAPVELTLTTTAPANGGSSVARHEGRVVFVRYALPGEKVRARVTDDRGAYWHAEAVEVIEASADRIPSMCPIAGLGGAGCCDLAFVQPTAARALKAEVVANQLSRLGGYQWRGVGQPVGSGSPTGWRTRVRLAVGADGRAGFHRYHSSELVTDLNCAQLPDGMLDDLAGRRWPAGCELHVVIDDAGCRHVVRSGPKGSGRRRPRAVVVEGGHQTEQRVGRHRWQIPVTGFWQAHRDAARVYTELVVGWAQLEAGMSAWDLYGGAGLFAAVLAEAVGDRGRVLSVDTSAAASQAARKALADMPQVEVVTDSVRRVLSAPHFPADVAVLDPPRSGAGRDVIGLLAAARVRRLIHIGCDAASFARDIGFYRERGYSVEDIRVFDSFPLTHHVECVGVLSLVGS
jgi:tRNA/tmRNA/rRNA uracil-C5-methylase (TrmA/RlmC/RlmD family)